MTFARMPVLPTLFVLLACSAARPAPLAPPRGALPPAALREGPPAVAPAPAAPSGAQPEAETAAPSDAPAARVDAPPGAAAEEAPAAAAATPRARVVQRVRALVGLDSLATADPTVTDDCAGLVRTGYRAAGVELRGDGRPGENAVTALHRLSQTRGALHRHTPQPGDLVFFRETYDRDGDRKRDDGLTHIGVVEAAGADGTVSFVHRTNTGVRRSRLNLRQPALRASASGEVLNDYLRRAEKGVKGARGRFTGELFAGYASADRLLEPARPRTVARTPATVRRAPPTRAKPVLAGPTRAQQGAKAGSAKAGSAKAGSAKAGSAKAGSAKAGSAKAASPARKASAPAPRSGRGAQPAPATPRGTGATAGP
jgi:cell wall-associated NlpC family hydrolase